MTAITRFSSPSRSKALAANILKNVCSIALSVLSPLQYAVFLSGIGLWLTAVECALVGLISWEGVVDEGTRKPAPITREVLQVLLLDDRMSDQLMNILTEAARLLIVEGKPSGA